MQDLQYHFATLHLYEKTYRMTENEISKVIVDVCCHVHVELGLGLLQSIF
jgi:hypothetical protein